MHTERFRSSNFNGKMVYLNTVWIHIAMAGLFGTAAVAQACRLCGSNCCKDDETCETKVDGGTCFKTIDRVVCNAMFYCYEPMECCGLFSCCAEGLYCKNDHCYSRNPDLGGFRWYYILIAVGGVILISVVICVWKCRQRRQAQQGQVFANYSTNNTNQQTSIYPNPPYQPEAPPYLTEAPPNPYEVPPYPTEAPPYPTVAGHVEGLGSAQDNPGYTAENNHEKVEGVQQENAASANTATPNIGNEPVVHL